MTRTTYYVAASLDGYIADEFDGLDWLLTRTSDDRGPMNYGDFIAGIGAMCMGAATYRWVLKHLDRDEHGELQWPYDAPCWVLTHHADGLEPVPGADVRFTEDGVEAVHDAMVDAAAGKDVWVIGGGVVAAEFVGADLVDEIVLNVAPVVLGEGVPLLPRRTELRLEESTRNGDFACLRYAVVTTGPDADG